MSTSFRLPDYMTHSTTPTPPPDGTVAVIGMPGITQIQQREAGAAAPITAPPPPPPTESAESTGHGAGGFVGLNVDVGDTDDKLTSFSTADAPADLAVKPVAKPAMPQPQPTSRPMSDLAAQPIFDAEARQIARRGLEAVEASLHRLANLEASVASLAGLGAKVSAIEPQMKLFERYASTFDSMIDDLKARLAAVDEVLAARGLPTTATVKPPQLKLVQVRGLNTPAQLQKDGSVALYYNARSFANASGVSDQQEFTLQKNAPPRHVPVGYAVCVPAGYVCDVVVDGDVVASKRGDEAVEYVLPLQARTVQRTINGSSEICRLVLRKVEACQLKIERTAAAERW